jgi:hypothetical protein
LSAGSGARPPILWPTLGELWTFLAVTLPALAALLVPMPAVDLAYHLRAGAAILAGEGIPSVDTWTFTVAGAPWLDQQWGAQAVLAGVFQLAGWTGLAVLRAGLVGLAFWFVNRTLRSLGCASRPAAIITLLSFVVAAPALALRPQLFAIVLFAATMWILANRRPHPRRLWLIPVIAALWANLHGSYPLVIVLVGIAWLDEIARGLDARRGRGREPVGRQEPPAWIASGPTQTARREPIRTDGLLGSTGLALVGAVAAFATRVNPFGLDVWRYVVSLASNPSVSGLVTEWRLPTPLDPTGAVFYASLAGVLAIVLMRVRADRGRPGVSTIAPLATIAVLGLLGAATGRGLAWWALAAPVAAATLAHQATLTEQLPRRLRPVGSIFASSGRGREHRRSPINAILMVVLVVAGIALLPAWRPLGPAGVPIGTLSHAPQGIATELRAMVARGDLPNRAHVWNPQTWGSWLEYAAPETLVAVDSRIELFPSELWADASQLARNAGEWLSILDRYPIDAVVVASSQDPEIAQRIDASPAWELAYRDADGWIFLRSDK